MQITRTSTLSGVEHTREIPGVTEERLAQCWRFGGDQHIQNVFPELSPDDREYLVSGITPQEWAEAFGGDDE